MTLLDTNTAGLAGISILDPAAQKSVFSPKKAQSVFPLCRWTDFLLWSLQWGMNRAPCCPKWWNCTHLWIYLPAAKGFLCFSTSHRKDECSATLSRSLLERFRFPFHPYSLLTSKPSLQFHPSQAYMKYSIKSFNRKCLFIFSLM